MEEYPSPAEGIGLENRQAGYTARGFESLFLRHSTLELTYAHKNWRWKSAAVIAAGFFLPKKRSAF
jgi:hypothetical protein